MTQTAPVLRDSQPQSSTIELDGVEVAFTAGETLFQISERMRAQVPTLCYDERLEAFGACRLCVVEVEGFRNPVASCTTKAVTGMKVRTRTAALESHRKTLLELVASESRSSGDHAGDSRSGAVDPLRGHSSQELVELTGRYGVDGSRFQGEYSGHSKLDDTNPFILRDYDLCISCYRCVRVCAEREGDYAISVANRGFHTQITTEFDNLLVDSSCTFCGQCVQTCPTGALADKKALRSKDDPKPIEKTRTICPYCGVGCSVDILTKGDRIVAVQPAMDGPANAGALCVKGQFAYDHVHHPDRLKSPMVRGEDGVLREASWDEALDRAAAGFLRARKDHGDHAIYAIASGRAPHESAYTIQKWVRATYGTNYVDNCSRA